MTSSSKKQKTGIVVFVAAIISVGIVVAIIVASRTQGVTGPRFVEVDELSVERPASGALVIRVARRGSSFPLLAFSDEECKKRFLKVLFQGRPDLMKTSIVSVEEMRQLTRRIAEQYPAEGDDPMISITYFSCPQKRSELLAVEEHRFKIEGLAELAQRLDYKPEDGSLLGRLLKMVR